MGKFPDCRTGEIPGISSDEPGHLSILTNLFQFLKCQWIGFFKVGFELLIGIQVD
jgi:hypothetical protein